MTFVERLRDASRRNQSLLCVGLDPDPARIPAHLGGGAAGVLAFCAQIVEATADLACAFKPNAAFFEALGPDGFAALAELLRMRPGVPFILDAKRGDIGSTAEAYARAAFDALGADAITLSPFLGGDSLEPFLRRPEKGCFILCKTSNPGGGDLQDLRLADGGTLSMRVARLAAGAWNANGNVGLVVGATYPGALAEVRAACPTLPLLVPGVGAQGGELEAAVRAAVDSAGEGALVSASRSILYASGGRDFAEAARAEAARLRQAMRAALAQGAPQSA